MNAQPVFGTAMAGFASHPFGDIEIRAAFLRRHVVRMAIQAKPCLFGGADTKLRCDALPAFGQQGLIGGGMGVVGRPGDELVLQNSRVLPRLGRPVACGCRAGLHTQMDRCRVLGVCRC